MDGRPLPIPVQRPGIRISMLGHKLKVAMDTVGLVVVWDTDRMVTVEATAQLWNRTSGLCGTLDQDVTNEFRSKDGTPLKVNTSDKFQNMISTIYSIPLRCPPLLLILGQPHLSILTPNCV